MSALYAMKYVGQTGPGAGAVYIGRDRVVGIDMTGITYDGSYAVVGGRMKGTVTLTSPPSGATLVTGQQLPPGQKMQLTLDWPTDFTAGTQTLTVGGRGIAVTFEKIGDIP